METQLLKFLRGGHLAQLQGMRCRDGPFVRPLLGLRKAQLREFLGAEGQEWMEDASNLLPVYQRNRVRLQLVPLLQELLGSADALHARFQALSTQSEQLSELLEELWPAAQGSERRLDVSCFPRMAVMLRQQVLWRFLVEACGAQVSFEALSKIEEAVRSKPLGPFTWQLGSGWELRHRAQELLVVRKKSVCRSWRSEDLLIHENSSVEVTMQVERTREGSRGGMMLQGVPLGSSLTLRGAQPGDYFKPKVNARAIKLTSFLWRAMQVPPSARLGWPVVVVDSGARPQVAGVLPDFVSGDFQLEEPELLPTRLSFSWQQPWPGLEKGLKALKLCAAVFSSKRIRCG